MGTTAISHTMQELLQKQEAIFSRIPGINALRNATPEDIAELEMKYPDAAFALMISDNLFVGDRELNEIPKRHTLPFSAASQFLEFASDMTMIRNPT